MTAVIAGALLAFAGAVVAAAVVVMLLGRNLARRRPHWQLHKPAYLPGPALVEPLPVPLPTPDTAAELLRRASAEARRDPVRLQLAMAVGGLRLALAELLDAQARLAEHDPEACDTETGRRALEVARAVLDGDGDR